MQVNSKGLIEITKRVELKPYIKRTFIHREFMTESEILANQGSDIALDVECFPNYFMGGFKHIKSGKYIKIDGEFNPRFLSWLLFSYKTIGFNSIDYDLPMLWASYHNQDNIFLKNISNALISSEKRPYEIARQFNFEIFKLPERQHIDLFNVCPLRGSLKLYGARLHSKRIQDLPILDTKILTEEEKEIVCEYNYNDLDVTELIFNFCKERIELRENISLEYHLDLMSKSDAQMAEAVISQEVGKLNGKWIKRPEVEIGFKFKYKCPQYIQFATSEMQKTLDRIKNIEFIIDHDGRVASPSELEESIKIGNNWYSLGIGGLHSKDKCKAYEAKNGFRLKDIDVTSYYPNAIINLELIPIAMGANFLTVYKKFKFDRISAKKLKLFTKDKGLKIFLNGVSGKYSDPWSKFYSPWNTIHMNLTGQLSILMLAEIFTCQGMEVVSANTDGLVLYYKEDDEDKVNYWIKFWEDKTKFELEHSQYLKYYARDVNAYFAVKSDNTTKVKGPYSEVGSQSGTQLDNNPVMLICSDAIKQFLANSISIEETIRECKDITRFVIVRQAKSPGAHKNGEYLGKVIRWYYAKNELGTINYVLTNNKIADSEGGKPIMDLPEEFPNDIDYDKYISLTNEILYDIGYFKRNKQIEFF